MPKLGTHALMSAAILMTAGTGIAFADTASGVAQSRLDLAGDLNVLVHEASASVCMINAGVAVEEEIATLADARTSFNLTLAALNTGEAEAELAQIEAAWRPLDGAMSMILAGDDPAAYTKMLSDGHASLEFATLQLLDKTANDYQHEDGVTMSDVLTVDIAERQEVFVQQLKQQACLMAADTVSTDLIEDFATTTMVFEKSLAALTDGVPEMGIVKSDSFEVNQVLAIAAYDWQRAAPLLDNIALNGAASVDELAQLRRVTTVLGDRMDLLVDYYLAVPAEVADDAQVAALTPATE